MVSCSAGYITYPEQVKRCDILLHGGFHIAGDTFHVSPIISHRRCISISESPAAFHETRRNDVTTTIHYILGAISRTPESASIRKSGFDSNSGSLLSQSKFTGSDALGVGGGACALRVLFSFFVLILVCILCCFFLNIFSWLSLVVNYQCKHSPESLVSKMTQR